MAVRAIVFGAAGTCGQRCTTLRRLIAHASIKDALVEKVARAYAQLRVGDPREPGTLVGPLVDQPAYAAMAAALGRARADGGEVIGGERVAVLGDGAYVRPALVRMPGQTEVVRTETFAPILYAFDYRDLDEAIARHNEVPQGLSSCIFTNDLREAERFLSADGLGLRHRQRQHRHQRRRDRRRVRRREGDRRRARVGLGRLAQRTCAARPTRSTTRTSCRWPRASRSREANEVSRLRVRMRSGPASSTGPIDRKRTWKRKPQVLSRAQRGGAGVRRWMGPSSSTGPIDRKRAWRRKPTGAEPRRAKPARAAPARPGVQRRRERRGSMAVRARRRRDHGLATSRRGGRRAGARACRARWPSPSTAAGSRRHRASDRRSGPCALDRPSGTARRCARPDTA